MQQASTFLTPHPSSVGAARRFVVDRLAAWGKDRACETTALLTSEVVTNAIKHVGCPVQLRLSVEDVVRVEVADTSPMPPRLRPAPPEAEGGRGLHLVDALSDDWGAEPLAGGRKRVWFEIAS
jgi:anti-sigma regulatory factor (Ser/Thr protein kinase)